MKKFKHFTLQQYTDVLSQKKPVPGGGSAAAYSAAMGCALLAMVIEYSKGKSGKKIIEGRFDRYLQLIHTIQDNLMALVDLDAQAYLKVVQSKNQPKAEKRKAEQEAAKVPKQVCRLCYQAIAITPFIVLHGNKYLLCDLEVAIELIRAGYNGAWTLTKL
ncbi:MAG: cyclodeaminase/cyclohydrolase family protein [Candidatus Omnitrophica bacterium]|nr:cyclodeaminase/cyclohydrolase family protein [Candidatus Omnitrophota bacterium]